MGGERQKRRREMVGVARRSPLGKPDVDFRKVNNYRKIVVYLSGCQEHEGLNNDHGRYTAKTGNSSN